MDFFNIKTKKYGKYTYWLALIIIFDHFIGYLSYGNRYFITGNLHPLYIVGILYLLSSKKDNIKKVIYLYIMLIIYAMLQLMVSREGFEIAGCIFNLTKIAICFAVMLFFFQKGGNVDYISVIKIVTNFMLGLFLISLVWRTPYLWRVNETINRFESVRVKLLYNEPSEVGLHLGFVCVIAYGLFLDAKISRKFFCYVMLVNLTIIYFAKPMLGMASMAFCIVVVTFIYIFKHFTLKRLFIFIFLITAVALAVWFVINSDSSIAQRARAVFSGDDSSARYRVRLSWYLLKQSIKNTYGIGFGFSRLTSSFFLNKYSYVGLMSTGITASFFNILVEGGFMGVGLVGYVINKMIVKIKINFSYVKLSMFCFILIYQLMGSYFTNPFIWMVYGLIMFIPIKKIKRDEVYVNGNA